MTTVPIPSFTRAFGESVGTFVTRIVRAYAGCSLHNRRADLAALVARGVDDPEAVVGIKTNCATFVLGVLTAAGVDHPLLRKPYVNGMAFAWLVQIGTDLEAWRTPGQNDEPVPGSVLWYEVAGENDDHAEFCLDNGDHGGGGRPDNSVTVGHGPIALSMGRPLHRWLDTEALGLPDVHVDPNAETQPMSVIPTDPEAA